MNVCMHIHNNIVHSSSFRDGTRAVRTKTYGK